jgi:arginine-tRNA-protein transferase
MARVLQYLVEAPRLCSYLPLQAASLEHRLQVDVTPDEIDALLEHGWRHFGPDWFRPACDGCEQCVPTRILAAEFTATRSQRRALRNCSGLRAVVGRPRVDDERLALYEAWHDDREQAREWSPGALDAEDYAMQFAFPGPAAREIAYHDDSAEGRLVAVGICDETPRAWSAIYCFYDPAYGKLSPGLGNVLFLAALARSQGKPYVHLGYRVTACPSLRYKSAFHPQEVLIGRPADDEEPVWQRAAPASETG